MQATIKAFFTEAIYSLSSYFNSYIITYFIFAVILAVLSSIYSILKSKNDRLCTEFAPYVKAVQLANIDKAKGDSLLEELYLKNNFCALPVTIFSIVYILITLFIFPSLMFITSEGHNIPCSFLWITDITQRTINIPMIIIYVLIRNFARVLNTLCFRKANFKKELKSILITIVLSFLFATFSSRMFSCLALFYLSVKIIIQTIIIILYKKLSPTPSPILVSDELKEICKTIENSDSQKSINPTNVDERKFDNYDDVSSVQ